MSSPRSRTGSRKDPVIAAYAWGYEWKLEQGRPLLLLARYDIGKRHQPLIDASLAGRKFELESDGYKIVVEIPKRHAKSLPNELPPYGGWIGSEGTESALVLNWVIVGVSFTVDRTLADVGSTPIRRRDLLGGLIDEYHAAA